MSDVAKVDAAMRDAIATVAKHAPKGTAVCMFVYDLPRSGPGRHGMEMASPGSYYMGPIEAPVEMLEAFVARERGKPL